MDTERTIQTQAVKELRKAGYTIGVTSNGRPTANTRGLPDVFAFVDEKFWIALEFKSPSGKLSPEQMKLLANRMIYICRSVDDAFDAVLDAQLRLKQENL